MSRSAWVGVDPSQDWGPGRLPEETQRSDFGAVKTVVGLRETSRRMCRLRLCRFRLVALAQILHTLCAIGQYVPIVLNCGDAQ